MDGIPNKLIKIAAKIIGLSLAKIFGQSIKKGIFPCEWKLAKVTPIFKKGDKNDVNNFRPISAVSTISKIFEKFAFNQITYLDENDLLASCQLGFHTLHSTLTALIEATNHWSVNIDRGLFNGVIFLDLKKAFDTIDHAILLVNYGVDELSLTWFCSYLTNRLQRTCVNGSLSGPRAVKSGVPHGSNLGPLLFLIFINDLPNCLGTASARMFADDTNISVDGDSMSEIKPALNAEIKNK